MIPRFPGRSLFGHKFSALAEAQEHAQGPRFRAWSPSPSPTHLPLPRDLPSPLRQFVHRHTDGPPSSRCPRFGADGKAFCLIGNSLGFLSFLPLFGFLRGNLLQAQEMCRTGAMAGERGEGGTPSRNQAPDLNCSFPDLGSVCLSKPGFEPCWQFISKNPSEGGRGGNTGRKESKETILSSSPQSQSGWFYCTDFVRFVCFSSCPLMCGCSDSTHIPPAPPVCQEFS